jgi:Uma2 family endonuclease
VTVLLAYNTHIEKDAAVAIGFDYDAAHGVAMTIVDLPARFTPDDLLHLRDNSTMELVEGQIAEKCVTVESSQTEAVITARLTMYAITTGRACVYPASLGYQVFQNFRDDPDRIRKPDTTAIRVERVLQLADPNPGYMPIVPDLAVEVLSPNDTAHAVAEKLIEYRSAGFPLVWVVDPELRTVTVHPNPGKPFILSADDDVRAESALPGFVCKVDELFPPTPAR